MSNNRYCVILAGGVGSRFWPESRRSCPKQFLDMLGSGRSLLQQTFDRYRPIFELENIMVVTNRIYKDLVLTQLPELREEQILLEPIARNTAPAICFAAQSLYKRDVQAQMLITPADHFISREDKLYEVVEESFEFVAKNSALLTIGVSPTQPETRYGYIQVSDNKKISRAKCLVEKPTIELAQEFVRCGEFLWNSGIFVWQAKDILDAFEQYMPENYALFSSIAGSCGSDHELELVNNAFAECRSASIEFGVIERAQNVYVCTGEFGWSDVGTWSSVHQLLRQDENRNSENSDVEYYNSRDCVVSIPSGKTAVISGLADFVVVDTEDILMICPREEEQVTKRFIDELKYKKGDKFL